MKVLPFVVGASVVVVAMLVRGPRDPAEIFQEGPDRSAIRVEVLNGSGVTLAGLGLAESMRDQGFDVVDIRNADHAGYSTTQVIDRAGNPENAYEVARHLELTEIVEEPDPELILEVTVILGKDRAGRYGVKR